MAGFAHRSCLWGGGQMVSINMFQMCEALGTGADSATAVSLFAVGNGLGRLVIGSVSDCTHRRRICPRPLWLCVVSLVMSAAHVVLALPIGTLGLYMGVFFVGCSFGSMFTLNAVIVAELWGLQHYGSNYSEHAEF